MTKAMIIIILIVSCNERNRGSQSVEPFNTVNSREKRIGETEYFLKYGENFREVDNGFGKEGQKTYLILTSDTASMMSISIEIDEGQQLLDRIRDWGTVVETIESSLLQRRIFWKVHRTTTNRYVGVASNGKFWVQVSSKNKPGIDSLISIVATLTRK